MRPIRWSAHRVGEPCGSSHSLTSPRSLKRSSPTSDSGRPTRMALRRMPPRSPIWQSPSRLALVSALLGAERFRTLRGRPLGPPEEVCFLAPPSPRPVHAARQGLPAGVGIRTALRSACAPACASTADRSHADRRLPLAGLRVGAAPATSPPGFVVSSAERPARLKSAQTTSSHRSRPPPVRAIPLDFASRR